MAKALRLTAVRKGQRGKQDVISVFGTFIDSEDTHLAVDDVQSENDVYSVILDESLDFETIKYVIDSSDFKEDFVIVEEVDFDIESMEVFESIHLYPDSLDIQSRQSYDDEEDTKDEEVEEQDDDIEESTESQYIDDMNVDDYSVLSIDDEIEDLIPSSDTIIRELNPLMTDVPVATSPWSIIAMSQQNSMIGMLYASMSKEFNQINKSVLDDELMRFKHALKYQAIYEVSQYLESKRDLINYRNDVKRQVETIRASYDIQFKKWVDEKLEELKQQYMMEHPDTTEDQVNNLLIQLKPEMDEAELRVETTRVYAEQAMIREFSKFSDHPELSAAMTFMTAKEQAKEALRNSIPVLNSSVQSTQPSTQVAYEEDDREQFSYHQPNDVINVYPEDDHDERGQFTYEDDEEDERQSFSYDNDEQQQEDHYEDASNNVEQLTDILSEMSDEEIKHAYDLIGKGEELSKIISLYKAGRLLDYDGEEETSVEDQSYDNHEISIENTQPEQTYQAQEEESRVDLEETQVMTYPNTHISTEVSQQIEPTYSQQFEVPAQVEQEVQQSEYVAQPEMPLVDDYSQEFNEELDLGNTGQIPNISDFVDDDVPSTEFLGNGSDVLSGIQNEAVTEFSDQLNQTDFDDEFSSDFVDSEDYSFVDEEIEEDEDEKPKKGLFGGKKSKKVKKAKDEDELDIDEDGSSKAKPSKAKVAILSAAAVATLGAVGAGGYYLTRDVGQPQKQESKQKEEKQDDNEAVLKFFDRAAKVGIDIDQAFTFTDDAAGEVTGTITSLRSDGSITVTLDNGEQKTVPFSVVKAKVVSLESQQETPAENAEETEAPAENTETTENAETSAEG